MISLHHAAYTNILKIPDSSSFKNVRLELLILNDIIPGIIMVVKNGKK